MLDIWNRKDAKPSETVNKIRKILEENGIFTYVKSENCYNDFWYSCRIEIDGLESVGTNGKGVSRDYALASAYGEFMERLQGGFLYEKLFRCCDKKRFAVCSPQFGYTNEKMVDYFSEELASTPFYDIQNFFNAKYVELITFKNSKNGEESKLPRDLVEILCGSNGLAAGNTFYEAIAQGLGEVFERFVLKRIYFKEIDQALFPVIDRTVYSELKSFALIAEIEKKGYHVILRDCTLGGKLPVVGVLIFDPDYKKYFFKIGSDINLDICIQRCITEIFQGYNFDIFFRRIMHGKFEGDNKNGVEFGCELSDEYIKSLVNGQGLLPRWFLNETECTSKPLDIFYNVSISNECAAKKMLSIAEKQFGDVYIANLDSLGFPTVRIFIKGVSTAYYWQGENPLRLIEINNRIRHHIKDNMINTLSMLNLLQEGRKFLSNKFTYKLRNITGVICNDKIGEALLNNYWFFCGLLALHNNCIKVARKSAMKIKEDGEFSQDEINVIQTTFNAIIEGKNEGECQNIISHIFKNEKKDYSPLINFIYHTYVEGFNDIGRKCKECSLYSSCLVFKVARE